MSSRDERLEQFFGCYFHQDWGVDGAESWEDVVAEYVREVPRTRVIALVEDLRSWVREAEATGRVFIPANFNCDYCPLPDSDTERQWVADMADLFETPLTN